MPGSRKGTCAPGVHQRVARALRIACVAAVLFGTLLSASAGDEDLLWYSSLGVEEGLSQNFVTALTADRDGFMWFGTLGGLDRWNGYEFESYKHVAEDSNSLSASAVLALHVDRAGQVWVGTSGGIDRFVPATNAFRRYGHLFRGRGDRRSLRIGAIASDRVGGLWFADFGSAVVNRLDVRTGRASEYVIRGTGKRLVTALYVDEADRLWVAMQPAEESPGPAGGEYQLLVFERASSIGDADLPPPRSPLHVDARGGKIVSIIEDAADRVWLGRDGGGLIRYDPATGAADRLSGDPSSPDALTSGIVRSLARGPMGEIWVLTAGAAAASGSSGGPRPVSIPGQLHRVDAASLTPRRITLRERVARPASDAPLERLAVDPSGVLWVTSNAGGVRYADISSGGFSLYRKEFGGWPGLNSSFVRAVCRGRDGALWVGTPGGLNRIDRTDGEIRYSVPKIPGLSNTADPGIQALHEDRGGNLWIGTPRGLVVVDGSKGAVRRYQHDPGDPRSLADDWVQVIHEDAAGRIWIGTLGNGVSEFDAASRSFLNYSAKEGDPARLPSGTINAIYSDRENRLWVGTGAGLARMTSAAGAARRVERISPEEGAIGDAVVLSIAESTAIDGVVWIGTEHRGLYRLDVRGGSVRAYTTRNSDLADDTIYGILPDRNGRLWMSTNRGVTWFDPRTETFRSYGAERGLQSSEFNARAFFLAPDGEMFFGGVNGLNAFYPDRISDNPNAPRVFVTAARTLEPETKSPQSTAPLIYRHGMSQQGVSIPYRQRDITIDYVALHYSDAERNAYLYKLENYDSEWHGPNRTRTARYTNLDPGSYTFRVKALSSHGVESDEAVFAFTVLPPFYATDWFRVLSGAGMLALLVGVYRLRVRSLRGRQEELELQVARRTEELRSALETLERQAHALKELDAAKSRFFANISHEFRTPLALTLGPLRDVHAGLHGSIPAEAGAEIELAIRNTNRQLELVDQLLTLARLDAGQLDFRPRTGRLDECVRLTAASFDSLARRQGMEFSIELPGEPVLGEFDEEKVEQVIGNLLANAFKFTPPGGAVALRLTTTLDGWATILVEDTGPGIPPQDLPHVFERFYRGTQEPGQVPGTGIGLALAKECVDLHGGDIRAETRPGGGCRFTVRLRIVPSAQRRGASQPREVVDPGETGSPVSLAAASERGPDDGRAKVLVVEDHEDMRAYLRKHLAPHYEVLEAARGDEALVQAQSELPDVIVSDVMMPGLDGYGLCRAIKSNPDTDFLPVILLTAKAAREGRLEGLEGGADDYVTKPFEPAELLARIRNLLLARERLKARFVTTQRGVSPLQPTPLQVQSPQDVFLERLRNVLDAESQDESFDVESLADRLGVSRAQLHRRVKEAAASTPAEVIIRFRLERAAQMLAQRSGNVGEVAYAVGFKNLSHFVRRFREQYGQTPSAYAASHDAPPPVSVTG